jgi:hypothetical protein
MGVTGQTIALVLLAGFVLGLLRRIDTGEIAARRQAAPCHRLNAASAPTPIQALD